MNQHACTEHHISDTNARKNDSSLAQSEKGFDADLIPDTSAGLAKISLDGPNDPTDNTVPVHLVNGPNSMPQSKKLTSMWTLYCSGPVETTYHSAITDLKSLQVSQFDTINTFWGTLNNIPVPSRLVTGSTYSLFRSTVTPRWEDPGNEYGGQWVLLVRNEEVKSKNETIDSLWESIACALVGEDMDKGAKKVNGIVYKIRSRHFTLQVWTKSALPSVVREVGEQLRAIATDLAVGSLASLRLDFYSHQQMQEMNKKGSSGSRPQPLLQL